MEDFKDFIKDVNEFYDKTVESMLNKQLSIQWYAKEINLRKTIYESGTEYNEYYNRLKEKLSELLR